MTSWKSYASAINNLQRCNKDLDCELSLPFSKSDTLMFIGWILSKKLKSSTASKYLSGIRTWHLANGWDEPMLRDPLVKQVLDGAANFDKLQQKEKKDRRLPMTIVAMKLLNKLISKQYWPKEKKTRVWFTACLAWAGSFRIHEILSRQKRKFDPTTTLIGKRFKIKQVNIDDQRTEIISVFLRCPKEDKSGKGVTLEIFKDETFMCPSKAWYDWRKTCSFPLDPNKPLIREASGSAYTGKAFQKDLTTAMGPTIAKMGRGKFSTHSFRAGKATELAKNGFSEEQIKRTGRWHSDAYLSYTKLPRQQRLLDAKQIRNIVENKA